MFIGEVSFKGLVDSRLMVCVLFGELFINMVFVNI